MGWPLSALILGLFAGVVANAAIARLPENEPWARSWFSCPRCRRRVGIHAHIPVLGWVALGGRCPFCRYHIPTQEPVVEAVNGVLWFLIAASAPASPRSLATMMFVTVLLVLALIDLEHQILPDLLTLPCILLGVLATRLPGWPVTLLDAALSAGVGYFAMMALAKAAEMYYREEALGQGDWKMVAMLGAFLGNQKLVAVVLAANVTGALIGLLLVALLGKEGRQKLPLGTFLGACGTVAVFF